jgi:hypothetical protein
MFRDAERKGEPRRSKVREVRREESWAASSIGKPRQCLSLRSFRSRPDMENLLINFLTDALCSRYVLIVAYRGAPK